MLRFLVAVVMAGLFLAPQSFAAEKRPMKIQDLYAFQRVADPQPSPDGKFVVYQIATVNFDENRSVTNLWIAATDGSTPPRRLTTSTKSDRHPRWSPDGKQILFESNRNGDFQLFLLSLDGGEARQITHISTEANNALWSPDGKKIAFVSAVYPEFSEQPFAESDAANKKKIDDLAKNPVKVKVFTHLFYRHWNEYVEDRRQHIFVTDVEGKDVHDVTPGDRDAYPTSDTFSAGNDFTFTPDSQHIVFTAVPARDEAWSTNYDLCRVSIDNKSPKWDNLTADNPAADNCPVFSPDGKTLAYRAQKKAGYEADKWDVMTVPVKPDGTFEGKPTDWMVDVDLSANEILWARKDDVLFTADHDGYRLIYNLQVAGEIGKYGPRTIPELGTFSSLSFPAIGNDLLVATRVSLDKPAEVVVSKWKFVTPKDYFKDISKANVKLFAEIDLRRPESVEVPVEGAKMQMWILKPPGFDPAKKWPVAFMVHGGPQGAWEDSWSYRWNPELWAAQGYVVVLPNPRGSTGFGQKFVDQISGDWGGKCYDDLMKGADYVEKLPYVDKDRIGAAGASFGGYMMNWFSVNTGRFKCLISHDGVWDFDSMWGTTDELWFDEYEHGGLPWEKPESYAKFSPLSKAGNLGKFKTPMLVIHNDLDFRCPIGQGHRALLALQRMRVPSRFVNFPDEGHWVLKPREQRALASRSLRLANEILSAGGEVNLRRTTVSVVKGQ